MADLLPDDMQPIKARIAYIQSSGGTMIVGGLTERFGDGRLWHMVDCDVIIIPRKTYVQAGSEVMSREYAYSRLADTNNWKEIPDVKPKD
jgi:hypothetical protein